MAKFQGVTGELLLAGASLATWQKKCRAQKNLWHMWDVGWIVMIQNGYSMTQNIYLIFKGSSLLCE
jgi:hypothetical protein